MTPVSRTASFVAVFLACLAMQACGQQQSSISVYIDPSLFSKSGVRAAKSRQSLDSILGLSKPGGTGAGVISQSMTDLTPPVSCVGLNVMGSGISSAVAGEGSGAWNTYSPDVLAGDSCSYPGKVSNLVSVDTGGTLTVKVPFGTNRVIQLVGYSGVGCSGSMTGESMMNTSAVPGVYELGRAVSDLFSASPTIDLEFTLNTLNSIDSNETAATLNDFVPDIRCQAKGEPAVQYAALQTTASGSCAAGTYWTGSACANVGAGYYSTGDGVRQTCTNAPTHSSYTSATATSSNCAYSCTSGYYGTSCGACAAGTYWDSGTSSCAAVGLGYYSTGNGVRQSCTNKPANAAYTDPNATSDPCAFSCNTNTFGASCTACAAGTYWDSGSSSCAAVGVGHYSLGDGVQLTCSNKPTDAAYSDPNATSATCPYLCNTYRYGSGCVACAAGTYWSSGAQSCVAVGAGYYSTGTGLRLTCSNKPTNSQYTDPNATSSSCAYSCLANFYGTSCVACSAGYYWNTGTSSCDIVGIGYYSTGNGQREPCLNANSIAHAVYTDSQETQATCDWGCDTSWYKSAGSCIQCAAGTYWDGSACSDVGAGWYSTGGGVRYGCDSIPSNSHYTGTQETTSTCAWSCDTGYQSDGNGGCQSPGIECGAGKIVVGLNIWADTSKVHGIQLRCASYDGTTVGSTSNGSSVGGTGGTASTFDCDPGDVLAGVWVRLGTDSTLSHRYKCRTPPSGNATGWSGSYGVTGGSATAEYTCSNTSQNIYRINVSANGSFLDTTDGVSCR